MYVSCMKRVEIGHRITKARTAKGLTQQQLAEITGHAVRTIASWEANARHPRMDALAQLAETLDRDVSWFYGSADHDSRAAA
jgi:transcriptional regulator with XRE-family HTH domain